MEFSYASDDIRELAKALLNVQRQLQPAVKDAVNPFIKNKYATLNSVMDCCRSVLIENGILLTQYPVPAEPGYFGLVTKLVHAETGQYQASLAMIPLAKNDAQGLGSACTYGRRYALSAMLGIVTEEDDDGNAASFRQEKSPSRRTSRPQSSTTQKKIPLSQMLSALNLADYIPHYRQYLEQTYGCPVERMNSEQYQEQAEILRECESNPVVLRGLLKTLNTYRKPQPIRQ